MSIVFYCSIVLLLTSLLLIKKLKYKECIYIVIAIIISSIPLFLHVYMPHEDQDMYYHMCRVVSVIESLKQFHFPLRIAGSANNTYGSQFPIFYPSLFLYIPALFYLVLKLDFINSLFLFYFIIHCITAINMYIASKKIFKEKNISIITTIIYILFIYRNIDIYSRGALGEFISFAFFPLLILGFYQIFFGEEKDYIYFIIGATGIFNSHMISTLLYFVLGVILTLVFIKQLIKNNRLVLFIKTLLITLLLNAGQLIPLIEGIMISDYRLPFEVWKEGQGLIDFVRLNFDFSNFKGLGIYFTLCLVAITIDNVLLVIKYKKGKINSINTQDKICFVFNIIIILFATFSSNLINHTMIANANNILSKFLFNIQFPYRFNIIIVPMFAMSLSYFIYKYFNNVRFICLICLIVNVLFVSSFIYSTTINYMKQPDNGFIIEDQKYFKFHDYTIKNTKLKFKRDKLDNLVDEYIEQENLDMNKIKLDYADRSYTFYSDKYNISNLEINNVTNNIKFDYEKDPDIENDNHNMNRGLYNNFVLLPKFAFKQYKAYNQDGQKIKIFKGVNNMMLLTIKDNKGSIIINANESTIYLIADFLSLFTLLYLVIFNLNSFKKLYNKQ